MTGRRARGEGTLFWHEGRQRWIAATTIGFALPARCLEALHKQRVQHAGDQLAAGAAWQETGLVFTTAVGTEMDAANVRRDFRRALALVPGVDPEEWTPREPRHSFVSVFVRCRGAARCDLAAGWAQRDQRHRACLPAPAAAGDSDRCHRDGPAVQAH